jgi:hypothetical protein
LLKITQDFILHRRFSADEILNGLRENLDLVDPLLQLLCDDDEQDVDGFHRHILNAGNWTSGCGNSNGGGGCAAAAEGAEEAAPEADSAGGASASSSYW